MSVTWAEALHGLTEFVEAHQHVVDEPQTKRVDKQGNPCRRVADVLEVLSDEPLTYAQIAGRIPGAILKESVKRYVRQLVAAGKAVEYPVRGAEKAFVRKGEA